jgi:hypothetical protein
MAQAKIHSGRCGFNTIVEATFVEGDDGDRVKLTIQSECKSCQRLAEQLTEVDPFREFSYRRGMPLTLELAAKILPHTSCPVPSGIIKAIEVAAHLALPLDASITLSA